MDTQEPEVTKQPEETKIDDKLPPVITNLKEDFKQLDINPEGSPDLAQKVQKGLLVILQSVFSTKNKSKEISEKMPELDEVHIDCEESIKIFEDLKRINSILLNKMICEVIWILTFNIKDLCGPADKKEDAAQSDNESKKNIRQAIIKFIENGLVTLETIQEELEEDALIELEFFSKDNYVSKRNKIRTNMLYELKKFNLFREENEGYARLITELVQPNVRSDNIETIIDNIFSLIGFFRLDPNRVIDVILDCYSFHPDNDCFQKILFRFIQKKRDEDSLSSISHILRFKIKNSYEHKKVPERLIKLAAYFIKNEEISLEEILEFDEKDNPLLNKNLNTPAGLTVGEIKKISEKARNPLADLNYLIIDKRLKAEEYYKDAHTIKLTQLSSQEKEKEKLRAKESLLRTYEKNFQLLLLSNLVKLNCWRDVEIMTTIPLTYLSNKFENVRNDSIIDAKWHRGLCQNLCDLLMWCIDPMYKKISPVTKFNRPYKKLPQEFTSNSWNPELSICQVNTVEELFVELPKIMRVLGAGISSDLICFTKLIRLLCSCFKKPISEEYKDILQNMLNFSFLPALSSIESNPGISNMIWELLQVYSSRERYEIYDFWFRIGSSMTCESVCQMCTTEKETLDWCKRVNNEKAKEAGRLLSRISCSNPLVSFDIVISNIRAYRNLTDPTLIALNYCSQLSLDCIAFTLVRQIMDFKTEKIEKTGTLSAWLQNITSFAGQFFKKHHNVDLNAIFVFLLNHIKQGFVPEMSLLRDIVMFMSGWVTLDLTEMTQNQIECLAGGFLLRIEASEYTEKLRSSKYSERALKRALYEITPYCYRENEDGELKQGNFSFAFLFMVLVGVTSKTVLYCHDSSQLRFLSSRHDDLHSIFIQINEFLMFAEKHPSSYEQLLPTNPLHVLTRTFGMHPEQVFTTIRHCLKPLYELSPEEFKAKTEEFKDVLDYHLSENAKCIGTECSNDYFTEKEYLIDQKNKVWNFITPELYTLFWYLQLSNIHCPIDKYKSTTEKIQARPVEDSESNKKKKSRIMKNKKRSIQALKDERDGILKNIELHETYIKGICENLFSSILSKNILYIRVYVIQYLIHPRMVFSPRDAIYVIKFMVLLTKLKTPYFNLIGLIGFLLKETLPYILCCTEKESHNFGLFFLELYKTLNHWQIREIWDKECYKTPGFYKKIVKDESNKEEDKDNKENSDKPRPEIMSYNEFLKVHNTLGKKILDIVKICLKRDYMAARNAIVMLKKLETVYPTEKNSIDKIKNMMEDLINTCEEDDLKTLANAYISILNRKIRANEPNNMEKGQIKEDIKGDSQRKRDDKYHSKSKSRERPRSRHSNRDSRSPTSRDRSRSQAKRDRKSKSPRRSDKRSKSKDMKDSRKRQKN
ncbi:unnamed protein product [Moneuplotes crassus]|uniref:THO complex subunit 2 n=2 Tax=Euplotes crassus TaxID=5936 RepID=A0AAD1UAD2_EUPCR|nr:unnamed protein product [Moneuplotes crassus]